MDACSEEEEVPIYGNVLEAILSHVPLISLLPASHVSKSWNAAVSSALLSSNNNNTNKPSWLIVHKQNSRYPYPITTHAYDPASNAWIRILHPPIHHVSTLRSSHSNLLYMLSSSRLSVSFDPLHLTWRHAPPLKVSRIDPVVAVCGDDGGYVVVAGGAYDFEEDPLAVEVYDRRRSHRWTRSDPMPDSFIGSASSMWLSVACCDSKLFVMEKSSGLTHSFDPDHNSWSGPYDLRPDHRVFHSVIGFSDNKLFVIGMLGEIEDFDGIKIWKVNRESFEFEEIGEMPENLVEDLKRRDLEISSINLSMAGNMAYIHIPSLPEEVIVCELIDDGGGCRWCSVVNTVAVGRNLTEKLVFTCSKVGMEELQRATRSENRRFVMKR